MSSFSAYLQAQELSPGSIGAHEAAVRRYQRWCQSESLDCEQLNYREVLGYVQSQQQRELKSSTINIELNSLTKYYAYLIHTGARLDNPARELRVKTPNRQLLPDLLTAEQLQGVYQAFKVRNHPRYLVMLGLMIWQGAGSTEFKQLEKSHLDFDKGTIYLPGSKRSAHRTLPLASPQIIPLHSYVQELEGDFLFSGNLGNQLYYLLKVLKSMCQPVSSARQIRSSVIVNWLKNENIRKVQYMAGHKYISSTERYRQQDLDSLQKALEQFHPLSTTDTLPKN